MATLIPVHPIAKPHQEVIDRIRELDNDRSFVLNNDEAIICLMRALADLTRGPTYDGDHISPSWLRRDFDISLERKEKARTLATELVNTGDVIIVQSILTERMAEIGNMEEDEEIDPEVIHLLYYLTYKCGWILSVLGVEDCINLGDNVYCLIKDPSSETVQPILARFNEFYGEEAEGIEFGRRYQIVDYRGHVLNPLDRLSWRNPKSTPHEQGYDKDDNDAFINDDDQQEWTDTFPLDIRNKEVDGETLRRLYRKLDSVTEYKNHLAAEVVRLNAVINRLKNQL